MPGDDGINPVDIAHAVMGLRFDRITSIKFEIRPSIGLVAKDIDRLALDITSFREPLERAIKRVIIPSIRKNFDQGGRPAWEPLAEATIIRRGYSAWPILQVTGKLRRRATEFGIWNVGQTSATVRSLPADAFYGVYHQAGSGETPTQIVSKHGARSPKGQELFRKYYARAKRELKKEIGKVQVGLGVPLSEERIRNRAIGMMADAGNWSLPARPFIMYQDEDIPRIEAIFIEWMTERAIRSGRFTGGV